MAGMKRVIDSSSHRQEVVAGNMAEYLANRESVSPAPLSSHCYNMSRSL
jgi:hypothetical protein